MAVIWVDGDGHMSVTGYLLFSDVLGELGLEYSFAVLASYSNPQEFPGQ